VLYEYMMGGTGERGQMTERAAAFSVATGISRLFGLAREIALAYLFGAGYAMDAFRVAFNIPNMLREFFAEGTLNAAFIPVFSTEYVEKGKEEALRFANTVLNALVLVVTGISVLCVVCAPWIMKGVALGFARDPAKLALTSLLARINFPFLVLAAISALMMGVINYSGRFFVPAVAPALFNIGMITCGVLLHRLMPAMGWDPIVSIAIGVLVGGALQVAVQIPLLRRTGFRYRLRTDFSHPGLKRVLLLVLPVSAGLAATTINALVNTFLATLLEEGSVSYLSYSFRLMQLPIGLFGVAVAAVSLPKLSSEVSRNEMGMARSTFSYAMRLVFTLTIPASVLSATLSRPICSLLYERGNFSATDALFTSQALFFYSLTIFGVGASKVLATTFYSLKNPRTPMRASFAAVAFNVVLNLLLMRFMRFRAMAFSASLASILNVVLLFIPMRKALGGYDGKAIATAGAKISLASIVMGVSAWTSYRWLSGTVTSTALVSRFILLIIPLGIGAGLFLAVSRLLRTGEVWQVIRDLKDRFLRA
jgi:putative peptidoglycan lipid II flippase